MKIANVRVGSVRRWCLASVVVAAGLATAARADGAPAFADDGVPAALRAALGWRAPEQGPRSEGAGSAFAVSTDPSRWPGAEKQAEAWMAMAPSFKDKPSENLMRRLALIEALALNAGDPAAREKLGAQGAELVSLAGQLRASAPGMRQWEARSLARDLGDLGGKIGEWLADSPAERAAVFRAQMAALRPPDRKEIEARYGGAEKLAALIAEGREYARLKADVLLLLGDPSLKGEARRKALAAAYIAFGNFEGAHRAEKNFYQMMDDPDLKANFTDESDAFSLPYLQVPDLVGWVGKEQAESLLKEAFTLPAQLGFVDSSGRTAALARVLIEAGKIVPKTIPWALFNWPDDQADEASAKELIALHDAMPALFAEPAKIPRDNGSRNSGMARLAAALGSSGRTDEALALLKAAGQTDPEFPWHGAVSGKFAAAVWDFLAQAPGAGGTDESWSALKDLARQAGRDEELVAFAKRQAGAAPAGSTLAATWRLREGWALVAVDKPDEALALLTPVFEAGPKADDKDFSREWRESATRLLLLAAALPNPKLDASLREKVAEDLKSGEGPSWADDGLFRTFARQALARGDFAQIETLLRARLAALRELKKSRQGNGWDSFGVDGVSAQDCTRWLADVLAREGRAADVVRLLAESSDWGADDLSRLMDDGGYGGWRPPVLVAAESLHAVGRDADARRLLEAFLGKHPASDPAYQLYASIRGVEAAPFFDKLASMDRYEARPLIWKAQVLFSAGQTAGADKLIRQAIAIDPSDGGSPHGDRMRAYAVAREIALKEGDEKRAELMGSVVKAIRMAEAADDVADAGLIRRAIQGYQRALDSFADAYCIQSRLAIRLADEHRMDEALEHYKRAYELMPDSFGRVESHCFGCERAFAGERPQSVAEKVFEAMIARPPVKPQAFYLMGYLREEQERWGEAADYFTKAVTADPDYLNAWSKLADALRHTERPRAERDRVALKLLSLDPYQRHGNPDLDKVRDLPALWKAVAAIAPAAVSVPDKLYALGDQAPEPAAPRGSVTTTYSLFDGEGRVSPAAVLAGNDVLEAVARQLEARSSALQRERAGDGTD